MAKGCVYIPKTGKDAGKVFGSKETLAAHMNYTPALADMMAKYQKADGKMDVDSVTKWLTDNGYIKPAAAKPTTKKTEPTKKPTEKKPTTKKEFPTAPVTDAVKAALKTVDNTTAAIMNLSKVLPSVYESLVKQVKLSIGKPASQQIAEAYHNAVENGVEPGLVSAVENAVALQEQMKSKPSLAEGIETNETLEVEGVPMGTRASNKASIDALERKHSDNATKKAVIAMVKKAARTLKSVFPSMDIHVHEDSKQYAAAMNGLKGQINSSGNFSYTTSNDGTIVGRIDINLSKATPKTVAHEVTHAILLKMFGDNSAAFLDFRNKIEKIISASGNKRLSDFADQYKEIGVEEIGQAEEYLAELAGMLSDKQTPLEYGIVRKIAELINKLVSTVTFDRFQPFQDLQDQKNTLEFFNTIAQTIKTGQEYDINSMGLHGEIKATGIKSKSSISSGKILDFDVNPNAKVEEDVPLSRFNGKVTNLIESDRMIGGYIADKKGKPLFKFFGGVKFPPITGKWWASRTDEKARDIAKNANNNRDKDGYIYSSPMIGSETQHMSNADMLFATIELMKEDVKNKKSKVTQSDVVAIMNKALGRVMLKDKKAAFKSFFEANSVTQMFNELEFILFQQGTEKGEYLVDKNGNLLLNEQDKKIPLFSFDERLAIVETLLGDPKLKEPRFPMAGSITDTAKRFTEPVSGRAQKIGDLVMVMRTKGTLKHKKTPTTDPLYHKSYPYEIYAENEDGTPAMIEVFYLDGAYSMRDVVPELKQSSGKPFSFEEYVQTHGATRSQAWIESQYNRTAKLSYASGEIKSKPQLAINEYEEAPASEKPELKSKAQLAVFDDTGYVSTDFWVENIRGNTKYLDSVIKSILDARSVLKKGKVTPERVVKAYMITLGSMGSSGIYYDTWKEKTGQTVSDIFLEKEKGRDWLRPEGAAAAYLVTDEGERLVDDMIAGTASAEQIKALFDFVGLGRPTQKAAYAIKSMQNGGIKAMTDTFNENKGKDFAQLYQAAMDNLEGIGEGKTGFFNQYFGVSGRAVIDARELNAWIAGSMKLTPEQEAAKKKAASSKAIGDMLLKRIEEVGLKLGYSPDMAGYIAHHAIWDTVKGSVTTHEGEYAVVSGKKNLKSKPQLSVTDQLKKEGYDIGDGVVIRSEPGNNSVIVKNFSFYKDGKEIGYLGTVRAEGFYRDREDFPFEDSNFYVVDAGNAVKGVMIYDKAMRGKGLGSKMYEAAQEYLQKQDPDARLASSSQVGQTEESYKLWKKLYEQGKADIIYREEEGGNIYYGEDVGRDFGRGGGEPNGVIYDGNVYALKQKPGLKSKSQVDAYHGTGYEFDRFSADKIGTGEGAQAFGWGLYFTDVKEIADEYAKKISFKNTVDNFLKEIGAEGATFRVWQEIISYMPEGSKGEWLMEAIDQNYYDTFRDEEVDQLRKFAEYKIKNNNKLPVSKNVYSVILHQGKSPDQYTWLEWNKPVSKTLSKINRDELAKKIIENSETLKGLDPKEYQNSQFVQSEVSSVLEANDGGQAYNNLSRLLRGDKKASMFLLENGIDGVKYPAESLARGTTSDTARGFNYVVFDENAVTIKMRSKSQLADNNAKEVADLYAQMREGGGWAERQKINAILDGDPKLSYIYNNFKEITRMLEDAQLLTKSGNCP